ncbi:MAG: EamA-like transporter family protein [Micromonosporaceae bacterium]|nr:EamA-like transporter family protein [Micromonosporaceae bacterium]
MVERAELILGVALAVVSGVALAVQSRINGELGARLGDGVLAALISFGGGLLLLFVLVPLTPRARIGLARLRAALRRHDLRLWQCLGGLGGASLVAAQGLTVGVLGVAIFTVAVVAGQTGSSLLVDRAGLGPGGRQALTWPRVVGGSLTLLAVAGAMSGRLDGRIAVWLVVLPFVAGCAIAVQQAVNGKVRGAADSALTATLLNFLTGTAALALAWLFVWAWHGPPIHLPAEPWLYVGGPLGIVFIAIAAMVVRWTGVLLYGLSAIAGQLAGAVLLDLVVPAQGVRLQTATFVGAAVALVAVGVAALPGGRIGRPLGPDRRPGLNRRPGR